MAKLMTQREFQAAMEELGLTTAEQIAECFGLGVRQVQRYLAGDSHVTKGRGPLWKLIEKELTAKR